MDSLSRIIASEAIDRLQQRDTTLFTADAEETERVAGRLGWTRLARDAADTLAAAERIAGAARAEDVTDVVLLGMGGSSLASLVLASSLKSRGPKLHVLDTVSPVTVSAVLAEVDPSRTLWLFSSKSGGTIEPNSLYATFRKVADEDLGHDASGRRFIAITDPGTVLESRAREEGFRDLVNTPADVGGRFSALTAFGLVPAALVGADAALLIDRAAKMETACAEPVPENPAAALAAFMLDAQEAGADKLTIVADEAVATFGLWVEQLVAESLGKRGQGIVPVVELGAEPSGYGPDRAVVVLRLERDGGKGRLAAWADSARENHPVFEIQLADAYDLGAEFVRWEYAVALAGSLMGINPFDEPNVSEAKAATNGILAGDIVAPTPQATVQECALTFAGGLGTPSPAPANLIDAIGDALDLLVPGDYLALLAFLPDDASLLAPLASAVTDLSIATGVAVCLELGPRYLHSTGQLHKGGPNSGVFVMITTRDPNDVAVPDSSWDLSTLHRAQAEGDLVALVEHDRRVLRIDLPDASEASVSALASAMRGAAQRYKAG